MGSQFVSPRQLGQLKFETAMPWGKTSKFDQYSVTSNAVWGDEAFEAKAAEDVDVMGPQGGDDMLGMGQTTVPAPDSTPPPPAAPPPATDAGMSMTAKIGWAVVVGGLAALAVSAWYAPAEVGSGRRYN
jgi:hypothetical protein